MAWFEEDVIGRNMLDFGLSGWMADFGEYLPHRRAPAQRPGRHAGPQRLADPMGQGQRRAVASRGKTGQILFFMRAGYTGVQRYCPLLWAGDQSVDFSRHDGLQTVICGALSSGLLGNAYHHSDIGGYTSLFGNVRTAELIMRWSEMAAFTAVMRGHEGNRPDDNLQIDQDAEVLAHFAKHDPRLPASGALPAPNSRGRRRAPACRCSVRCSCTSRTTRAPMKSRPSSYRPDLLVAPVIEAGATSWSVYLPAGAGWTHVWSGTTFAGGTQVEVAAPLGQPPVFWREGSAHAALFAGMPDA